MQNVLVSHNYLPSSACTRQALFGLERGVWGERWDGGAGDAGPPPVPGTAVLSELHRPVGPHLLLHFTHCILLTMRQWCVVAFVPPTNAMLSPSSSARDPETGHGPAACNHPCSELVTTGSPIAFGLGQTSYRCRALRTTGSAILARTSRHCCCRNACANTQRMQVSTTKRLELETLAARSCLCTTLVQSSMTYPAQDQRHAAGRGQFRCQKQANYAAAGRT